MVVTDDPETILSADHVILPGVGAFDAGIQKLNETGISEVIHEYAETGRPILGICLGMQLLGRKSEEGELEGLGLIPFECKHFSFERDDLKIPHMGWDIVDIKKDHPIVCGLDGTQRYYFVHSYHAVCDSADNVLMTCDYGYEFAAAVVKEKIIGVQFHPESIASESGDSLFKAFLNYRRENLNVPSYLNKLMSGKDLTQEIGRAHV